MVANFRLSALFVAAVSVYATPVPGYYQTNLVSDIPGLATFTDANLKNPWGLSQGPTPIWVSDNKTGFSTIYTGNGHPASLVVTIPGGAPTGQVFNGTAAFGGDRFLFAGEGGVLTGWRGTLGTNAEILKDNSTSEAVYKGLAIGSNGTDTYLYAADFHNNQIYVFPSSGAAPLNGNFTDPTLPSGYAPFNVQNIDGQLYVAYAKRQATGDDEDAGPGRGYVSVFDLQGNFVKRVVSNGPLNAPWGMAMAPLGWGPFGGDLLVGNFGDGSINAFDPVSGAFRGKLSDANGNPIINDGLWGIKFGTGGGGTNMSTLYFAAGLNDEENGLFGSLRPTPEPGTAGLLACGIAGVLLLARKRLSR